MSRKNLTIQRIFCAPPLVRMWANVKKNFDKMEEKVAHKRKMSTSFRGIKPVSALDLFHGLVDISFLSVL